MEAIILTVLQFAITFVLAYTAYKYGYMKHSVEVTGAMANIMRKRPDSQLAENATNEQFLTYLKDSLSVYRDIFTTLLDDDRMKKENEEYRKFKQENPLYGIKRDNGVDGKPRETNRTEPDSATGSTH